MSVAHLHHLPLYAQYLLKNKLQDFVLFQMQVAEEIEIPIVQHFKTLSYEQRLELASGSIVQFLNGLAQNKAKQFIEDLLKQWRDNKLPGMFRENIVADDITLMSYLQKRSLTNFITEYTTELNDAFKIIKEIDLFLSDLEAAITTSYVAFLKEAKIMEF
jgi:uncharacterized protein HemY